MLGIHFEGRLLVIDQPNGSTTVLFSMTDPVAFSIIRGETVVRYKLSKTRIRGWRDATALNEFEFGNKLRSALRIAVAG